MDNFKNFILEDRINFLKLWGAFWGTVDDIMNGNFEKIKKFDIFILQYPKGGEISFSQGNIIKIIEDRIIHSVSTKEGSSGSPIILRNNQYNYKICGIHFKGNESKKCNFATTLNKIINDIERKDNQISFDKEYLTIETNKAFENIILLNDERISGFTNIGQIIIYNKEKYDKIDLTIKGLKMIYILSYTIKKWSYSS